MFNKAAIILTAGLEIRLQYRFTFCPLLYVYFQFNVEVTLQSGFTRERKAVYQNGADSIIDNTTVTLKGGNNDADRQYWFVTSYKGFGIQFKGKLYVECHKFWDKNNDGKYEPGEPFDPNIMLNHNGKLTEMYSWDVNQNIGSGQTVKLATDGACKALTDNLVAGDYFYITVAEDSTAFTTGAYSYNSAASNKAGCSLKYTIADKTDLGVEKLSAAVAGVDDNGNAKIDMAGAGQRRCGG